MIDLNEIAGDMLETGDFWSSPDVPFKAHLTRAHPRLLLVTGDNGSGKSLFVEFLRGWGKEFHRVDATISISIRERTGAGLSDMSGMRKSMIFGQEEEQSTGSVSARVTQTAFNNLDSWSESGRRILMVLDEPEMGLSQAYATPLGELIAQLLLGLKSDTGGVVLVSHNKGLVRALMERLGEAPSFVHLGPKPLTLLDWLADNSVKTLDELLALPGRCSESRRQVRDFEKKQRDSLKA